MKRAPRSFWTDRRGVTMVEFAMVMGLVALLFGAIMDFGLFMYRYVSAQRGVQVAARNASLLAPVAADLRNLDWPSAYAAAGLNAGDPLLSSGAALYYDYHCSLANGSCLNDVASTFGGSLALDTASLNRILYGLDFSTKQVNSACRASGSVGSSGGSPPPDELGLCDFYKGDLTTVEVRYTFDGAGYAYRPDGPIPRVSVVITQFQNKWIFLGGFFGSASISPGPIASSMSAQAISTLASAP